MEHRYRLAGHSERAVRQGEFSIARHLGDTSAPSGPSPPGWPPTATT